MSINKAVTFEVLAIRKAQSGAMTLRMNVLVQAGDEETDLAPGWHVINVPIETIRAHNKFSDGGLTPLQEAGQQAAVDPGASSAGEV